jgi:MATE family multidrug resistance protein
MEAPLLIKSYNSESDYLPVKSLKDIKYVLWSETVKIWKIALPVAFCSLFQYLNNSSNSIYAGHLGDIELSSFSVYQSVITSIYFSMLVSNLISISNHSHFIKIALTYLFIFH